MALVDNLLEHWSLDSILTGSSGALNLTQVGTAFSYTAAILSNGIVGAGASGRYLTYTYNSAIPAGTVAFWYKATGDGTGSFHRIWSKTTVGVSDRLVVALNNYGRRPSLTIQDTTIVNEASDTLTRDVWYSHVITWDGSTVKWYINGVETYSVSSSVGVTASTTVFALLGWAGNTSQQPAGVLDEPAMWLRALTASEVTSWHNAGAGLAYPFTVSTPSPYAGLLMMGV